MAIFTPSHLIAAISGSLGSVTFKATRNGPVLAKRARPSRNHSPTAHRAASRWATLISHWQSLTQQQRNSWTSLARNYAHTDALGVHRPRQGLHLFLQHATPAWYLGLPLPTSAPELPHLPAPLYEPPLQTYFAYQPTPPGSAYLTGINPSLLPPVYAVIYGSRATRRPYQTTPIRAPFSPRWLFKSWKLLKIALIPPSVFIVHFTAEWDSLLGFPIQNEPIAAKAYLWHPTALRSNTVFCDNLALNL